MPTFHPLRWASLRLCLSLIAVALPAATVMFHSAESLASDRAPKAKRGWLGIVMDERPGGGVAIKEVLRGSPAEKARLLPGDLLLRVNGATVSSARDTARAVGGNTAGSVVRIAISRNGAQRVVPVRLEPYPSGERLLRMQHVGRPAPPLRGLKTGMGRPGPVLDDFKGKVLVLDFWASWCVACRVTSNHMNRWHDRYESQGLAVLGVAGEPPEEMVRGTNRFRIRYPTCADPQMKTSAAYHVRQLPSVMLVDRRGIIRDVTTGFDPQRMREMERMMQRLLAEPAPTK